MNCRLRVRFFQILSRRISNFFQLAKSKQDDKWFIVLFVLEVILRFLYAAGCFVIRR